MGLLDNLLLGLDDGITGFFRQWNVYTTIMATALVGLLTFHLFARADPDAHPMLLSRQAQGSPVRQPGESPVYRSHAAPHGMPLSTGLQVKDPGAARWARGRDGDLRDIWRQALAGYQAPPNHTHGAPKPPSAEEGARGRILTILGTEKVTEHSLESVTRHINLVGRHIGTHRGSRVAIYLPNSVELLATLFACAFYDLTAIIVPFDLPEDALVSMLTRSAADTVVTSPGSFSVNSVIKSCPGIRQLVWVVDPGSNHIDWDEVPEAGGGSVSASTWREIIDAGSSAPDADALPPVEGQKPDTRDIVTFWQTDDDSDAEMVRFTSANLVAAVAGQLLALPASQRMGPADLLLPADSLANTHTLVLTLAALYSNASVAFNSAAAQAADLDAAMRGAHPTIVVATPSALLATHREGAAALSGLARVVHGFRARSVAGDGAMPSAPPSAGPSKDRLRLIVTADRAGAGGADPSPKLTSAVLTDLRVLTGARVVYALTAARVAGAVTQTGVFDYRVFADDDERRGCHFGAPLASVELLLRDTPEHMTTDERSKGEIVARGPCVAGKEAALGVLGVIRDDNTLAYL